MKNARTFFSESQQQHIRDAIASAELDTSGEIRVHIESRCKGDTLERAWYAFDKLQMEKTAARNGVLFYLAVQNRKFAIIGDQGIHEKVAADYWDILRNKMLIHFRQGHFTEGLVEGIHNVGNHLKKYFPYTSDDINELPDDISFE